jgi:hypothetical protein
VFFLILARCGLYGGMEMGSDIHENGGRTRMTEQEWWQNTGMTDYSCSLNSSRDFIRFDFALDVFSSSSQPFLCGF